MTATLRALAARIREDLEELARTVERAGAMAEKAHRTGDDAFWDGVAFRQRVRHLYAHPLKPARPEELADELSRCFRQVRAHLEAFCAFPEEDESPPAGTA